MSEILTNLGSVFRSALVIAGFINTNPWGMGGVDWPKIPVSVSELGLLWFVEPPSRVKESRNTQSDSLHFRGIILQAESRKENEEVGMTLSAPLLS